MAADIPYDDLEAAFLWVSSMQELEAEAFVSRVTGETFLRGPDGPVDEDFPEGIEDDDDFLSVPHKHDLDLGRDLVFRFVDERAPHLADRVHEAFRHKGAYGRFKDLLARESLLDAWHAFEDAATREALTQWAADNGLRIRDAGDAAPAPAAASPAQAPARDLAIPVLPSRSIERTVRFYGRFGFTGGPHRSDPDYAILTRGDVEIHFVAHPSLDPAQSSAGCYVRVADVDGWFAALSAAGLPARGIPRLDPLADRPWGLRECALVDEDGNLVRIGQVLGAAGSRA